MDNKTFLLILIGILIIGSSIYAHTLQVQTTEYKYDKILDYYVSTNNTCSNASKYDDRCILYKEIINKTMKQYSYDSNINGVYNPNGDYYCVWVKDRNLTNIQRTEYHEACHSFVENDWDHFCNITEAYNK